MNILFLSYWGIADPLTMATVFPHLLLLQQLPQLHKIVLVTIERQATTVQELAYEPDITLTKVDFQPLLSKQNRPLLLNKLDDFVRFPKELAVLVEQQAIKVIVARGAPAGALAYLVWKKLRVPFLVESFEPHAAYMHESGVWRRYDPRFIFESYWEHKQKQLASGLMPVAENYRQKLLAEGVPATRVVTVPCSVDMENFQFDEAQRQAVRHRLHLPTEAIVGIYVGKFGGMYYEAEAFDLFWEAAAFFGPAFRLVLLTPTPSAVVWAYLEKAGFLPDQVFVTTVPPKEVPAYLSAADFAFATYKKGYAKQFLSPIKVGEYWATGLPVLLTEGVGDDSAIMQAQGGGAVFDLRQPPTITAALKQIAALLSQQDHRTAIRALAKRYRSIAHARAAYEQLLLPLVEAAP